MFELTSSLVSISQVPQSCSGCTYVDGVAEDGERQEHAHAQERVDGPSYAGVARVDQPRERHREDGPVRDPVEQMIDGPVPALKRRVEAVHGPEAGEGGDDPAGEDEPPRALCFLRLRLEAGEIVAEQEPDDVRADAVLRLDVDHEMMLELCTLWTSC